MTRRRHTADRYRGGRLRPAVEPELYSPAQLRRLRDGVMRQLLDPEWGSEMGLYFMGGKIGALEYAAGKRWRAEAAEYLASIGARNAKSAALEPKNGTPPDHDSPLGQKLARDALMAFKRFDSGLRVLQREGAASIVRAFVEHDQAPVGIEEFHAVRRGLKALAQHYGFGK